MWLVDLFKCALILFDMHLLCNSHRHVSASHMANVSVICLRTRVELYLKCVQITAVC